MAKSKLIYSTDTSISLIDDIERVNPVEVSQQRVRIHLDRKGGGKIVSVVKGLQESTEIMNSLAKMLKKGCGVGGAVKNSEILIQGNHREKIQNLLSKKGYVVKLSGG
jgi:translation initiation factor 1